MNLNDVFFYGSTALVGPGLRRVKVSRSHSETPYIRDDSSGRMIDPSQGPLSEKTQHAQETDIRAQGGIRARSLSKRAAADPRLRPSGPGIGECEVIVMCLMDFFFFFNVAQQPPVGQGLLIHEVSRSHTTMPHSR